MEGPWYTVPTVLGISPGLHLTPAQALAREARGYPHALRVLAAGREANARSSLELMGLRARYGDELAVQVDMNRPGYEEAARAYARSLEDREGRLASRVVDIRLRLAVVGLGDDASRGLLRPLRDHPFVEIVGVASRSPRAAAALAAAGVPEGRYLAIGDGDVPDSFYRQAHVVYVGSPPWLHPEHTLGAIRNGAIAMTDKPLAPYPEDFALLRKQAKGRDGLVFPFDHYLYKPAAQFARDQPDFLQGQQITGLHGVLCEERGKDRLPGGERASWRLTPQAGGGVLMDLGSHLTNLATALFGVEFLGCEDLHRFDLYGGRFPEESGAVAAYRARTKEGREIPVTLRVAKGAAATEKVLRVEGEDGALELDFARPEIRVTPLRSGEVRYRQDVSRYPDLTHLAFLDDVLEGPPLLDLEKAGKALSPIWMAYARGQDGPRGSRQDFDGGKRAA
ncbi:MAG: Gfo/Idh/MocA family oxidoreductase [Candidatus Aenigmarchaeota archaeon]|nr:Gfo/Idh/MocA family oxidoreductase [Candidatus Aenigmarchaeota archaeon]